MNNGTEIIQGSYTSDGTVKVLDLPTGVDWLEIINYTQLVAQTQDRAYKFSWQRGLGTTGLYEFHPAADKTAAVFAATDAFIEFDSSTYAGGSFEAVTAGTNDQAPVYSTGNTAGLGTGSIVRLKGTDQDNLNGVDFTIYTVVADTSFKLQNSLGTAPGIVAGASGNYKMIAPSLSVYKLMYPGVRNIADISNASAAVVTFLVDHDYQVGSKLSFNNVGSIYGMTEIDGLVGTVTAISAGTVTVDIDSSGFSAFTFPTSAVAATPFTYASCNMVGSSASSTYENNDSAPLQNRGITGMIIMPGNLLPGGNNNDVIYWKAGKSFGL